MARTDQIKLLLNVLEVDGLLDENNYVDIVEFLWDRRPDPPMDAQYTAIVGCFLLPMVLTMLEFPIAWPEN